VSEFEECSGIVAPGISTSSSPGMSLVSLSKPALKKAGNRAQIIIVLPGTDGIQGEGDLRIVHHFRSRRSCGDPSGLRNQAIQASLPY
jgi:hypothetical protein